MTNAELEQIYSEGNTVSHVNGLRAVFEAGRNEDARLAALEKGQVVILEEEPVEDLPKKKGKK